MYLHKVVNLDKNLSKVQKNKELHKAAFNLLEENLIKEFRLKKEDLKYIIGLNGKPCLKKGSPFFSISHCDNIVVCIISERNVGIDIEDIKEANKFIVNKALTQKEKIQLSSLNMDRNEYFFRIWTLKEALLKNIGDGLSYGIKNIEFDIKDDIDCNLNGFRFKQEKVSIRDKEYIISIACGDIDERY